MTLILLTLLFSCPGTPDEPGEDTDESGAEPGGADADGDGHGAAVDCDDADPAIHPGANESDTPCDGVDNDCDGRIDGGFRVPDDYALPSEAVAAASGGDSVCVGPGTYVDNVRFGGKDIQLIGVAGAAATVLMGATGGGSVVRFEDHESADALLRGFTISGGEAESGAGIYVGDRTWPTLEQLVVADNICLASSCAGTGIYLDGAGEMVVRDTIVTRNLQWSPSPQAAGMLIYGHAALTDVEVSFNEITVTGPPEMDSDTVLGGAILVVGIVTFTRVSIVGNRVDLTPRPETSVYGVGLHLDHTNGTFQNVVVADNVALCAGSLAGGVYMENSHASFTNVVIAGNQLDCDGRIRGGFGAGAYLGGTVTMTNVDIVGNALTGDSPGDYGGLYTYDAVLTNVSVADNAIATPLPGAAGAMPIYEGVTILYSSFSNNGDDPFGGAPSPIGTSGVIEGTPDYLDLTSASAAAWDLTLGPGSDLRDAGDPAILDADGTRSDIGSRGGPLGLDW